MKSYDLISSLFWFLVGLVFVGGGFRYGFGSWKDPGPGLLPIIFGVILLLLSITLLIKTFNAKGEPSRRRFWREKGSWKPVSLALLSLIGYMLLLKQAGFLLTTFLFIFFLVKVVGGKKWMLSILMALLFSVVCYGVFFTLLKTPLPTGVIYGSDIRNITRV